MGVRGLYTFICKCVRDGVFNIDMKNEVENYKRQNNGVKPIIIIDIFALVPNAYVSNHELILGGRHEIYSEKCRDMLNSLKSLDAELIFFYDGPFQPEKLDNRLSKRNKAYMKEFEILQRIDSRADISRDFNEFDLSNPTAFRPNLLEIAFNFGEVKMSCLNDLDQEAVELANRIKAFAIISWDTDYLILGGKWRYWSARDIDFTKLTTLEYNKRAMRLQLGLSEDQMALFGTLGGNDFLAYEKVEQFHRNITRKRENRFNAIAGYVRRINSLPPHLSDSDLQKIYNSIFDKRDRENGTLEFQNSLDFFCMKNMRFEFNNQILEQTSKDIYKFAFKILNKSENIINIFYTNLLNAQFTTNEIIIELIQRMMGVLLQSQKDSLEDVKRKIYCKKSHEKSYEPVLLEPIFPQVEVPSTLELLYHPYGENKELDDLRWDLLCSFISSKLERQLLLKIPKTNLVEILTIFLLVEKKQIEINEADSLLLACNCPTIIRNKLQFDEVKEVKSRNVELSYLFQKIFDTIRDAVSMVGLRNFSGLLRFDGLYFHILRKQWASGNQELTETAVGRFKDIRIYSTEFGLI